MEFESKHFVGAAASEPRMDRVIASEARTHGTAEAAVCADFPSGIAAMFCRT